VFQNAFRVGGVVADAGDAQSRVAPQVLVVHLGDGDVKVVSRSIEEASEDAAFVFQRLRSGKFQGDFHQTDYHGVYFDLARKFA
jgi:hypothetical protein